MKLVESDGHAQNGVSVILPVLNEERYLAHAVEAILSQDYLGKLEVILAIGPSTDRTQIVADELKERDSRVVIVENPSGKTAAGLNLAIKVSAYPVVVRVDGHAEIPNNYISLAVQILKETGAVNVGGVMAAEGKTNFERTVALAMRSSLGVGASRFHTGGSAGPVDTVYLGVFKRDALIAVGGFDERFTRAQDWELNYRLRAADGVVYFDPRLQVTYRPRPNLKALARQYFEYGRWRHVVIRRHQGTVNLRYLAPPMAFLGTAFSILFGLLFSPLWLIPACVYLLFLCFASLLIGQRIADYLRLPWILFTMHMSWGAGYLFSPRSLVPSG
ncbi:MAG TPA: glycosyltransferase family 2 protein [Candidatus Paceibacterota bacterium]|nr:glycosyltransferase family 2 protein [Candidatus Paceibacterota bacterium]